MNIKRLFIDVETTGLDLYRHGLIEFSYRLEETSLSGVLLSSNSGSIRSRPFDDDEIDENGLDLNRFDPQEIWNFPGPLEAYSEMVEAFGKVVDKYNRRDKFFMIGYNVGFDYSFLRRFFERNGDQYFGSWFFAPPIDVMALAANYLIRHRRKLPNFKLGTVAKIFVRGGVDETKLHNAMYDIELTKAIYDSIQANPVPNPQIMENRINRLFG